MLQHRSPVGSGERDGAARRGLFAHRDDGLFRESEQRESCARRTQRGAGGLFRNGQSILQGLALLTCLNQVLLRGVHLWAVNGGDGLSRVDAGADLADVQPVDAAGDPRGDVAHLAFVVLELTQQA